MKSKTSHVTDAKLRKLSGIGLLASLPFLLKGTMLILGVVGYLMQSLYKIFQWLIPVLWRKDQLSKKGWNIFWPFDEKHPSIKGILLALVCALILSGAAIFALKLLAPILHIEPESIRAGLDSRFDVTPAKALAIALFISLLNPVIEEMHFRAWLDREVSALCGNATGIVISAVAFGSMHILIFYGLPNLTGTLLVLIAIAVTIAGMVWSLLLRLRGGIHLAFLSHALTDIFLLGWGLLWLGYF